MYGGSYSGHRSSNYNSGRDRSREKHHGSRRDRDDRDSYEGRRRPRSRSDSSQRYERSRHERRNRDSRSNSRQKDRRSNDIPETYPERQTEQIQHRLRTAIRSNEIHFEAKLFEILRDMPLSRQQQIKDEAESVQKIHEYILVRQLFISGLQEMNENYIKDIMKLYGQIEKIEIVRNFAYVKFHRVESASDACAQYHNINNRIHNNQPNPNFKIFFADHIKRWNVVSNSIGFDNKEDFVPVVYASLKNEPPYNTEAHVRSAFEKFGFLRNVEVKIPAMKPYKTYALVQYETLTQAIRARDRIRAQREKYLGDRKSQVTLLLDSEKITRQCPNVKNQLRYQMKRQQNAANPGQTQSMGMGMGGMGGMGKPIISHYHQQQQQSQLQRHQQQQLQQQQQQQQQVHNPQNDNDIFAMIRQFAEKEPDNENDQDQSDWAGFMTRNKQFKVEVDFNLIHKVPFDLESIINVSHRGDLNEAITREDYVMAGKFKAANNLNTNAFNEYINYFVNKNKAGIIQTSNYLIYLVPPMESLPLPYPIKNDQLLALFFKL